MKQHEDEKFENESLDNESILSSASVSYEVSSTKEEELRKILKGMMKSTNIS